MATTQKMLYRGVLGTSSATLYTVPGSTSTIITSIVVTNYTATDATVTLTLQNGSGTDINLLYQVPVAGKGTLTMDISQVLNTTRIIKGLASTGSSIACHISGVEIT